MTGARHFLFFLQIHFLGLGKFFSTLGYFQSLVSQNLLSQNLLTVHTSGTRFQNIRNKSINYEGPARSRQIKSIIEEEAFRTY